MHVESIHTIQKNTEAFAVTNKENGLEVNAEKTKHMFKSQNQHAGQNHNIKICNKSSEKWNSSYIWEQHYLIKIPYMMKFCAESFVFQFAIQKYKDQDIQIIKGKSKAVPLQA
jgi:hypothetical protein